MTARNDIPVIVEAIDTEIQWLEGRQNCSPLETPYKTFWDDMALAKLLKGLALLQYASPFRESIAPPMELVHNTLNPQTKKRLLIAADEIASIIPMADKITKDGYILSFGRYELAQTYIRLGDYHRAQAELRAASKGGTLSHENVSPKKQFCNNIGSLLGVRIENMQLKLNTLLKLSQWKEERNEDIWAAYEDLD